MRTPTDPALPSGSILFADTLQVADQSEVAGKGLVCQCVVRHAPVKRLDLRGRMRRLGGICTAANSYTR